MDVGDVKIYYEIRGSGEPLLLINGLGAQISEFTDLIDLISAHRKVIAFDNRGAGKSDKPDVPYTIEMMAADTLGLLKALNVGRTDVVGISLGGRIAMELALAYPEFVSRLVLVSTSAKVVRSWQSRLVFGLIHNLPVVRGKQPRYAFIRQKNASDGFDCTDRLHEITAKTLILAGRKDRFSPVALQEELHSKIARSEFKAFDGGHLFFMMKERRNFLRTLESWLSEIPSS